MSSPLNFLIRKYLKTWDKELQHFMMNAREAQDTEIRKIFSSAYFQYFHPEARAASAHTYLQQVGLSYYDDYADGVKAMMTQEGLRCEYYAQSSGTGVGVRKLIPTPEQFVRMNHLRGSWYTLHSLYAHNPKMNVFGMKNLLIGGSIYVAEKDYMIGDVSGIMLYRIPSYMRGNYLPDISTAVLPEWEAKIDRTAKAAAKCSRISLIGGVPTWVFAVLRRVLEQTGQSKLTDIWPHVQAYIHGGVSFDPYKEQFEQQLPQKNFRYLEIYNATEGFFAFQDRPDQDGLLLMLSSGIYYEFIPLSSYSSPEQIILPIHVTELGIDYVLILTSFAGLARYVIGDVVRFVTLSPYRIRVVGRLGEYINAFGEDLTKEQAEKALISVAKQHGADIHEYTVGPQYSQMAQGGRHEWWIEFRNPPAHPQAFEQDLDMSIQQYNPNYAQKRCNNLGMEALRINALPKGSFDQYFKSLGRQGGQNKIQRLRNDRHLIRILEKMFMKE